MRGYECNGVKALIALKVSSLYQSELLGACRQSSDVSELCRQAPRSYRWFSSPTIILQNELQQSEYMFCWVFRVTSWPGMRDDNTVIKSRKFSES